MSPVGRLVFNTSEALIKCLVGSTPTSSANSPSRHKNNLINFNTVINTLRAGALPGGWPTWILVRN